MQVHILMFNGRIERTSTDALKMYDTAKEMNGEDDPFGPYYVVSMELEDAPQQGVEADAASRCPVCNDKILKKGHCYNPHCPDRRTA